MGIGDARKDYDHRARRYVAICPTFKQDELVTDSESASRVDLVPLEPLGRGGFTDHKAQVLSFQDGEQRFVWGLHKDTDQLWYLEEDTAREWRAHVKQFVICPVPGCEAQLTTAHRTTKRDGLVHLNKDGGHTGESIFHSQGCAVIENWLSTNYPNSKVKREEYTNAEGERRADVLITSPAGDRVAFEVQYSPLTSDAWRTRHESYRRQRIADVWLFGHTSKQLRFDRGGFLSLNPTHRAVIAAGSPVMFINPEQRAIGIATSNEWIDDGSATLRSSATIEVWDQFLRASLSIAPLEDFRPSRRGIASDWLSQLYGQTKDLRDRNEASRRHTVETQQREVAAAQAELKAWIFKRRPQQEQIRHQFATVQRWNRSDALASINAYFGGNLRDRIDSNGDAGPGTNALVRWQSVVYFDLVAGRSREFGVREAFAAIKARGVNMGQPDAFKLIAIHLHGLVDLGFLDRTDGYGQYPRFVSTEEGAWR